MGYEYEEIKDGDSEPRRSGKNRDTRAERTIVTGVCNPDDQKERT